MDKMVHPEIANCEATVTLFGDYTVSGQYASIMAHKKIANAIDKCTHNKPDPDAPPGHWATWLIDDGVYGEQMQTWFCLKCGEYQYLSYQTTDYLYFQAPSEPPTCTCHYHL